MGGVFEEWPRRYLWWPSARDSGGSSFCRFSIIRASPERWHFDLASPNHDQSDDRVIHDGPPHRLGPSRRTSGRSREPQHRLPTGSRHSQLTPKPVPGATGRTTRWATHLITRPAATRWVFCVQSRLTCSPHRTLRWTTSLWIGYESRRAWCTSVRHRVRGSRVWSTPTTSWYCSRPRSTWWSSTLETAERNAEPMNAIQPLTGDRLSLTRSYGQMPRCSVARRQR